MPEPDVELRMTRVFDAPRELVYKAFTDPDQLAQWFAPAGWSVPRDTVSIDPVVGGYQRFTMVNDSDPTQTSAVSAVFVEVIENELLVGTEDSAGRADGQDGPRFTLRLEFYDDDQGKTRLELVQGPYSPEWRSGAVEGWGACFVKLDALLAAA
jgi:uncharacterized protein YndB with AHSA1/START domain